jgi:endonuclease/exonuclease/phosphatase family metal-dependent hydrolase
MTPTPTLALHTSRRGKRLVLLAALTGLTAFLSSSVAGAQPQQGGNVRVMTYNMYMGNVGTLLRGTPQAVTEFFNETVATNPLQRAVAIARQIKSNRPDLVALQEVSILRKGNNNDPTIPATDVVHDQLQLLRDALSGLGEHYDTVAVIPNSDVQLPSAAPLGVVIRLTDRTAILARTSPNDLKLSNVQVEEFWAKPPAVSGLIGMFGWGSVDVQLNGLKFRFVATHLMPFDTPQLEAIQTLQASELIQSTGKTDLPVVYASDFNTVAGRPTYQILVDSGRGDAWLQKHPQAPCSPELLDRSGCTCCQDSDLHNDTSKLSRRIDLVIVPPHTEIEEVGVVGADPAVDHVSGLWPSDHGGLVAVLKLPRN